MSGVHVASRFDFQVASKSVASMWPFMLACYVTSMLGVNMASMFGF